MIGLRNYLRVRGEYRGVPPLAVLTWELPPRARRILAVPAERHGTVGTTSACAENTRRSNFMGSVQWNYLRVRGEYPTIKPHIILLLELPPRARRIPLKISRPPSENVNYLRVRGEYRIVTMGSIRCLELPPRARRIHERVG